MNLFDAIRSKYLNEMGPEKQAELGKCITTNLWPQDFIEVGENKKWVYAPEVTLENIFAFFKERIPWIRFTLNELPKEPTPDESLVIKYVCFTQLAGLLEGVHLSFTEQMKPQGLYVEPKEKNGPTVH